MTLQLIHVNLYFLVVKMKIVLIIGAVLLLILIQILLIKVNVGKKEFILTIRNIFATLLKDLSV
uniref:Uncharacterized protein n=1 Tax=candidate division WOR-3 bacterium TaxID=2052148 RepID=A0A7V3NUX0_UNCW3